MHEGKKDKRRNSRVQATSAYVKHYFRTQDKFRQFSFLVPANEKETNKHKQKQKRTRKVVLYSILEQRNSSLRPVNGAMLPSHC